VTRTKGKRPYHIKNKQPIDPNVTPISHWPPANRGCYHSFREWLKTTGFSDVTVMTYAIGARFVLGFLNKPYWVIDPDEDIAVVWDYLQRTYRDQPRLAHYHKGMRKFAQYLYLCQNRPQKPKQINWQHYLAGLPEDIAGVVRDYIRHSQRNWPAERRYECTLNCLSHLTHSLRWMAANLRLESFTDLTPQSWYTYLDARLAKGISAVTLNGELRSLWGLLHFAADLELPVCERIFRIKQFHHGPCIPKDVPLDQLRSLQAEVEKAAKASHRGQQRIGRLDMAWFLLMLHCGLRSGEVRRLRFSDLHLEARRVRIEQSKGLKDRFVFLSQPAIQALEAYLAVRGPQEALPPEVFTFRHRPLCRTYFGCRLRTYGRKCGVQVTPHQLRHTCATLLLNAGAPVLAVQAILGHEHIDTTMQYARLYDGTVAADYFQAMQVIEGFFAAQSTGPDHWVFAGIKAPLER
jgi:integrase